MENLTRSIVTRQPQSEPESSLEMTSETLPANRGHYGARAILPLVQGVKWRLFGRLPPSSPAHLPDSQQCFRVIVPGVISEQVGAAE